MSRIINAALTAWADESAEKYKRPAIARAVREALASRPAVLDEQWPAIRAYLRGDEKPLRAFVKKHIGASEPSYVFPALKARDIGGLDEWETWEFIEHHKASSKSKTRARGIQEQADALCPEIMKHRSRVRRALSEYEHPAEEVRRATFVARSELQSDHKLTRGKIEWRVEDDNRFFPSSKRAGVSLDTLADIFDDPRAVEAYDGVEDALLLRQSIARAGLTARELEILGLWWLQSSTPEQIADHFKVSRNTIDKHLSNIYRKVGLVA